MTNHSECSHPKTKAARAACRKLRAQGKPRYVEIGQIEQKALNNLTDPTGERRVERLRISSISYETRPCVRCGESGMTVFTHIDGGKCFSCAGAGTKMTAKGRRAKEAFDEMLRERSSKRLADLKPGDNIRSTAYKGHLTYKLRMRKIEEVVPIRDDYKPVTGKNGNEPFELWQRDIRFADGKCTYIAAPSRAELDDVLVTVQPSSELLQEIFHEIVKRYSGATATYE